MGAPVGAIVPPVDAGGVEPRAIGVAGRPVVSPGAHVDLAELPTVVLGPFAAERLGLEPSAGLAHGARAVGIAGIPAALVGPAALHAAVLGAAEPEVGVLLAVGVDLAPAAAAAGQASLLCAALVLVAKRACRMTVAARQLLGIAHPAAVTVLGVATARPARALRADGGCAAMGVFEALAALAVRGALLSAWAVALALAAGHAGAVLTEIAQLAVADVEALHALAGLVVADPVAVALEGEAAGGVAAAREAECALSCGLAVAVFEALYAGGSVGEAASVAAAVAVVAAAAHAGAVDAQVRHGALGVTGALHAVPGLLGAPQIALAVVIS